MPTLNATLYQKLQPSDVPAAGYTYGSTIAISGDGSTLVVGAQGYSSYRGRVYINVWDGSTYVEQAILETPYNHADAYFGTSISVNHDGTVIAVGAFNRYENSSNQYLGKVYIYTWDGLTWTLRDTVLPPLISPYLRFGCSVTLDATALKLTIGASGYDQTLPYTNSAGNYSGALYTYQYANSTWTSIGSTLFARQGYDNASYFAKRHYMSANGKVLVASEEYNDGTGLKFAHVYDWVNDDWVFRYTIQRPVIAFYATNFHLNYDGSRLSAVTSNTVDYHDVYRLTPTDWSAEYYVYYNSQDTDSVAVSADYTFRGDGGQTAVHVLTVSPYGWGTASLLSASGSGYAERYTYLGSGTATITDFSAIGAGILRTPTVLVTVNEYELPAFTALSSSVNGEYSFKSYHTQQQIFNVEYNLFDKLTYVSTLVLENALNALTMHESRIDAQYGLPRFVEAQSTVLGNYQLNAYIKTLRYFENQYGLNAIYKLLSSLSGAYDLSAFTKQNRKVSAQYRLNAYTTEQVLLNLVWGLLAPIPRRGFLIAKNRLSTYVEGKSYLDSENRINGFTYAGSKLNAEYTVITFIKSINNLSIAYALDAEGNPVIVVVGLDTGAISTYSNYGFNSISNNLGANGLGIYRLEGTTDSSTLIPSYLATGKLDFGSNFLKRLTDVYIGVNSDGVLNLTVGTESGEISYTLQGVNQLQTLKSNLARGAKGRYWQFKLSSDNSTKIDLFSLDALPEILSRRR